MSQSNISLATIREKSHKCNERERTYYLAEFSGYEAEENKFSSPLNAGLNFFFVKMIPNSIIFLSYFHLGSDERPHHGDSG